MPIRLIVAEDHLMVRQGLLALLGKAGLEVVGVAEDGKAAVELTEKLHPDIAILDFSMPVLNGLESARRMARAQPPSKIILLTMYGDVQHVAEALRAGVRGYVLKTQAAEDLIHAVEEVQGGGIYLSPGVSRVLVDSYLTEGHDPADPLSSRERQVLQLVADGKTTRQIASSLGISPKTAETHRSRIMKKLDIHETAGLVRYAIRSGLVKA